MEQLSPQIKHALTRFPQVELSYETISHTKVYNNYDIGLAIPHLICSIERSTGIKRYHIGRFRVATAEC